MNFHKTTVEDFLNKIHHKEIDYSLYLKDLQREILKKNKEHNFLVTLVEPDLELSNKALSGLCYVCKDNFSTKDILSTSSSNFLKNYTPVYDATVIKRLKEAGAQLIGKVALDELAMGGTGMNALTGIVRNAYNSKNMSGGSSSGSVVATALGLVPFALGSDTGDSIRKPAALNGVVGFKGTWGRISRYGLFSFAPALDHVGLFSSSVPTLVKIYDVIKGYDVNDCTSLKEDEGLTKLDFNVSNRKIGYIKEIVDSIHNEKVKEDFYRIIDLLKKQGCTIIEQHYDIKLLRALLPVYLVISCAEATSNNACLDGIKYGYHGQGSSVNEQIFDARNNGFSELVKRRFVIGSYVLQKENQEALFLRAQKVRRQIVRKQEELFKEVDFILTPPSSDVAPLLENTKSEQLSNEYLIAENHLVIANFAGNPSITIPTSLLNGLPLGININAPIFKDKDLLNFAAGLEKLIGFKSGIK